MRSTTTSILCLLIAIGAWGETRTVPLDFTTIQAAIDWASAGDTVFVQAGTYVENINFSGKDIVVMSSDGPDATIIDGNNESTVVKFVNQETRSAVLDGFTLTNGAGMTGTTVPRYGGGVVCRLFSSPTLRNLIIRDNRALGAESAGGGIGISFEADPVLENVIIRENRSYFGGGVSIANNAKATFINVQVIDNYGSQLAGGIMMSNCELNAELLTVVENDGHFGAGGIWLHANSTLRINRGTIVSNSAGATYGGAGIFLTDNSLLQLSNCILWDNTPNNIASYTMGFAASDILIAYSDIEGGMTSINVDDDEVYEYDQVMTDDPEFIDLESGDYHLDSTSLCIDAGVAFYVDWITGDTLVSLSEATYHGSAPELGAYEYYPTTGLVQSATLPGSMELFQNYPNPFNPVTVLSFQLKERAHTTFTIFDLSGKHINTLVNDTLEPATYQFLWDGRNASGREVPAGIYLYQLKSGDWVLTRMMSYMK